MIRNLVRTAAFGATILWAGSLLTAQSQTASDADKHFVRDAIEGGNGEVELGRLAQEKSSSHDIKQFGQKMVEDHTKLGDQMKSVAQKLGIQYSSGTSVGAKATEAELKILTGETFDKAYIKAMVKGHRADLKSFQDEAANGTSREVRDAAKQGSKVVEAHLHMVEMIARNHNVDVDK